MKRTMIILSVAAALFCGCENNSNEPQPSGQQSSNALFSVGPATKVFFSPGNLQFNAAQGSHLCADGTTKQGTWRFAGNQWDCAGDGNASISSTYNGWIDLFGWGTSGWESGAKAYQPWSKSEDFRDYFPGGSDGNSLTGDYANADWGVYNQIGDDEPGTWRTLTRDELYYLIYTRTDAGSKYGAAKVNGVTGVVILPDFFSLPAGCGFKAGMTSASEESDWSTVATTNTYTSSQWQLMEAAGAVFLPCAGNRYGATMGRAGTLGDYWSSTADDVELAYELGFGANWLYTNSPIPRYYGFSVRLVR